MALVQLQDVSIDFPVYDSRTRSLKNQLLRGATGGEIFSESRRPSVVHALSEITGTILDGDHVALVGHNGAGKSTLLRVLAGIYEPCSGSLTTEGHVAPLFDISLGMDPEATGHENIILRGLFLGMTHSQISQRIPDIVEFTELGRFLELPVRTYSAGMRLRLAFAVSTAIEPEILLIDEGIAAGDEAFLHKARERLRDFISQAAIIVLASHSPELIQSMCNTAVLLDRGRVISTGPPAAVLEQYRRRNEG